MSNYINTVDSMGDEAICEAVLEKTLGEIIDTHCTTIGGYAFYKFYDLRSAIFANATRIEQYAFAYCSKLEAVEIPLAENVGYFSFYECTKLKKADFPNVKSVNRYAFNGCTALDTLVLRSTTFAPLTDVNALTDTLIESGKGYIYVPSALYDSYVADSKWSTYANQFRKLEDYTVDGTLTGELDTNVVISRKIVERTISGAYTNDIAESVGGYAFYECKALTSIDLPAATSIGVSAFYGCSSLTSVNSPVITSLGSSSFDSCVKLTSIDLPALSSVGYYAFRNCSSLASVNLPVAKSAGERVFYGCSSLTSVNLPVATSIGTSAFCKCSSLTSVDLPVATSIGDGAFEDCVKLTSMDLPVATRVRSKAFDSCRSLTSVILRSTTVCSLLNTNAFTGCYHILGTKDSTYNPNGDKDGYIYVPRDLVESYKADTNWSTYATQFRAIEDYTVDGTITGELDATKI